MLFRRVLANTATKASGRGGQISVKAKNTFVITGNSRLASEAETGTGDAGDIAIATQRLIMQDSSQIRVVTDEAGRGGNLIINASEFVDISGFGTNLEAQTRGIGDAGDITVNTKQLLVRDGAFIFGGSEPDSPGGRGGTITINASKSIDLIGTDPENLLSSGILSDGTGRGPGGNIHLNTQRLSVREGAVISASTLRQGQGGNVEIQAAEVELSGGSPDGRPSGIFALAGNVFAPQSFLEHQYKDASPEEVARHGREIAANVPVELFLSVRPDLAWLLVDRPPATGRGGDINIRTETLTVLDGAQIGVSGQFAEVDAGNIKIDARSVLLNRGSIVAETASGEGGNIDLRVQEVLLLRHGSKISTTAGTAQAGGNGGNIDINAGFVVAVPGENSDITANAFNGNGGSIRIRAKGIFGLAVRSVLTPLSDITASSQLGLDGTVTLDVLAVDPSRGLAKLPENPKPVDLVRGCYEHGGIGSAELYDIGRGGMSVGPEEPLQANPLLGGWMPLLENRGDVLAAAPEVSQVGAEVASTVASLLPPCKAKEATEARKAGEAEEATIND